MKEIKAYVRPFMLNKVTEALKAIPVRGMSVTRVSGFGKEKDELHPYVEELTDFTPKAKLEIVCRDEEVEQIVETIKKAGSTGRRGDGMIFISSIDEAISIHSCDRGEEAI